MQGRGGLVVRSRFWGQSVPGSKPDSTEDLSCLGPVVSPDQGDNANNSIWIESYLLIKIYHGQAGVVRKFGEGGTSSDAILAI
ncbi:hypothetical protein AVEN_253544-1 [Araneus ventricosus]|uniref:Uncharacterized protein n=1 Tax=Araneus ventricosus TaxID=182803 RepID=A0A4Y2BT21_ARAVE|nr:hypothetical protein AVEN_253544-1 [Araneus ventricosus]